MTERPIDSTAVLALLNAIGSDASKTGKEAKLKVGLEDPTFLRVVRAALDPYVTYGVKPKRTAEPVRAMSLPFDADSLQPWDALDQLARREVTGNAAADLVFGLYGTHDAPAAELIWRILNKDLRMGCGASTVNKARPNTIPTFDVMLAHPYDPTRKKTWPVAVEPKLDGFRAVAVLGSGRCDIYFRSGKPFEAVAHMGPALFEAVDKARLAAGRYPEGRQSTAAVRLWRDLLGGAAETACVIDGEVVMGDFLATSSAARRKGVAAEGAEFHAFDVLPLAPWLAGDETFPLPLGVRREAIHFVATRGRAAGLFDVPAIQAVDEEGVLAAHAHFREMTLAAYLARGDAKREAELLPATLDKDGQPKRLEGAVVKPLSGLYRRKRDHAWGKIKDEITEDLVVTGSFEGAYGTKLEGKFGGFVVDREGVAVRVGGGFTDAQRAEFGLSPVAYVGRRIEVEAHEVTPDGSLRHSRFVRFRPDLDEA